MIKVQLDYAEVIAHRRSADVWLLWVVTMIRLRFDGRSTAHQRSL